MRSTAESAAHLIGQVLYFVHEILALAGGRVVKFREIRDERRAALYYGRARSLERAQRYTEAYRAASRAFSHVRTAGNENSNIEMGCLVVMRLDSLAKRLGIAGGAQREIGELVGELKSVQAKLNYPSSFAVAIADLESRLPPADRVDSVATPSHDRTTSGRSIVNHSSHFVYYRREGAEEVNSLEPGGRFGGVQDGLALPALYPGRVYKGLRYIDVTIREDGVLVIAGGIIFELMNRAQGGGWKDKSWLAAQQRNGDHSWDALFQASEKTPESSPRDRGRSSAEDDAS